MKIELEGKFRNLQWLRMRIKQLFIVSILQLQNPLAVPSRILLLLSDTDEINKFSLQRIDVLMDSYYFIFK